MNSDSETRQLHTLTVDQFQVLGHRSSEQYRTIISGIQVFGLNEWEWLSVKEFEPREMDARLYGLQYRYEVSPKTPIVLGEILSGSECNGAVSKWLYLEATVAHEELDCAYAVRGELSGRYAFCNEKPSPRVDRYFFFDMHGSFCEADFQGLKRFFQENIPFGGMVRSPGLSAIRERHGNLNR